MNKYLATNNPFTGTRRVVMHELVVDEARSTRSQKKKKKKDDDEDDGVMWLDLSQAKCIVLNEDYNDGLLNLQEQLTFETDVEKVRRRQLENFNLEEKKRQSKEDNYLEQERLERLNQIYDGIIISVKDSITSSEVLYREDKKCLKEIQKVAWMLKKEANMVCDLFLCFFLLIHSLAHSLTHTYSFVSLLSTHSTHTGTHERKLERNKTKGNETS